MGSVTSFQFEPRTRRIFHVVGILLVAIGVAIVGLAAFKILRAPQGTDRSAVGSVGYWAVPFLLVGGLLRHWGTANPRTPGLGAMVARDRILAGAVAVASFGLLLFTISWQAVDGGGWDGVRKSFVPPMGILNWLGLAAFLVAAYLWARKDQDGARQAE